MMAKKPTKAELEDKVASLEKQKEALEYMRQGNWKAIQNLEDEVFSLNDEKACLTAQVGVLKETLKDLVKNN
jgi:chromosome segregation ATPase